MLSFNRWLVSTRRTSSSTRPTSWPARGSFSCRCAVFTILPSCRAIGFALGGFGAGFLSQPALLISWPSVVASRRSGRAAFGGASRALAVLARLSFGLGESGPRIVGGVELCVRPIRRPGSYLRELLGDGSAACLAAARGRGGRSRDGSPEAVRAAPANSSGTRLVSSRSSWSRALGVGLVHGGRPRGRCGCGARTGSARPFLAPADTRGRRPSAVAHRYPFSGRLDPVPLSRRSSCCIAAAFEWTWPRHGRPWVRRGLDDSAPSGLAFDLRDPVGRPLVPEHFEELRPVLRN